MAKQKLIVDEMRVLANYSEFGKVEAIICNAYLKNGFLSLTDDFMELFRLVSLDEFTRDAQNISTAIDDFLSNLHSYSVSCRVPGWYCM